MHNPWPNLSLNDNLVLWRFWVYPGERWRLLSSRWDQPLVLSLKGKIWAQHLKCFVKLAERINAGERGTLSPSVCNYLQNWSCFHDGKKNPEVQKGMGMGGEVWELPVLTHNIDPEKLFWSCLKDIYRHIQYFATELTFTSTSLYLVVQYMVLAFLWLLLSAQILCTHFPTGWELLGIGVGWMLPHKKRT